MQNSRRIFPIFFVSLFMQYTYAQTTALPAVDVQTFCATYTGQSDFLKDLSQKILKDSARRIELVKLMRDKKAQGCQNALSNYLNKFMQNDSNEAEQKNFQSYLLLAFASNLPIATQLIEEEISKGKLIDWLDIFQKTDQEGYFKTLSQWVGKIALLLRQLDNANIVEEKQYGKMNSPDNDIKTPESIPIWNPIIINKYMTEIISNKIKLTKSDFANLNIIYSASNQSYRDIFLPEMTSVIKLSESNWIMSFRVEPSWVQFRLLPVMGKVGGGLMKRELIWLSNYHQNFKIRSIAQSTLDKMIAIDQRPLNPTNE